MIQQLSIQFSIFFLLFADSCVTRYCQDGIQVYFPTEAPTYDEEHNSYGVEYDPIYGHYELQPNDVNGRPYFKMGFYGFWYDGLGLWWIGSDTDKGQSNGGAYYEKDVFCPHQLSEINWVIHNGNDFYAAGNDLVITCKCIIIQKQNIV